MLKYIVKRILILIPVLFCVTVVLFSINKMMPGDPVRAMLPTNLKSDQYEAAYAAMEEKLGTNKPIVEQYFRWMGNLFEGEFGWSSNYNRPVKDVLGEPLKNTMLLNLFVIILQLGIAIPVGIRCATHRGGPGDNFWQVFSLITYSMPSFFVALTLIFIFGITLGWFPLGSMPNTATLEGMDLVMAWARHLVLPTITLTIISLAGTIRYVRNAMLDALSQDYIRTARSKGLSEKVVVYSHAFRNALIPISTIIVGTIFSLFAGAAITETVFAWNGIGKVLIGALNGRDFMLVMTLNLFFAAITITANFIADITYGLIDPRIKLS